MTSSLSKEGKALRLEKKRTSSVGNPVGAHCPTTGNEKNDDTTTACDARATRPTDLFTSRTTAEWTFNHQPEKNIQSSHSSINTPVSSEDGNTAIRDDARTRLPPNHTISSKSSSVNPRAKTSSRPQPSRRHPDNDMTSITLDEGNALVRRCLENERTSSMDNPVGVHPSIRPPRTTLDPNHPTSSCPSGQYTTCWDFAFRYCCPEIRLEWLAPEPLPLPRSKKQLLRNPTTDATNTLTACPSGLGECWDFAYPYCCPRIAEAWLTARAAGTSSNTDCH